MHIAGSMVSQERHPGIVICYIYPMQDHIVLNTIPTVKEGVGKTAFRDVIWRILAKPLLRQLKREQHLQFKAVIIKRLVIIFCTVMRCLWSAYPGISLPIDPYLHINPSSSIHQCK